MIAKHVLVAIFLMNSGIHAPRASQVP
jgi:hypothetical protein